MTELTVSDYLRSHIRTVPDWPAPGVQFRDITPLLQNPRVFRVLIDAFVHRYMDPALRRQLVTAFERSGLSPSDYLALVQGRDEAANHLVQEALHDAEAQSARRQALQRAYEASGKPVDEFAQMYGMDVREVRRLLSIQ